MSDSPYLFSVAFAVAVLLSLTLKFWLSTRQIRHVIHHRGAVPPAFAAQIPLAAHQKAADYTVARGRFGMLALAFNTAALLGWTLLGGLGALNAWLLEVALPHGAMAYQLALLVAFTAVGTVLDLPWELWNTFKLEQRFGFNRMTLKLYVVDTLKGIALSIAIGIPFAALILWLMGAVGSLWWLWAWGATIAIVVFMQVIGPLVIAPWFNKFVPLDDDALRARVEALMERCGMRAKGVFSMDGSLRSAHSNAYFGGLGPAKRVVLFDTLLAKLSGAEIEAVLAHELGHFKHSHITKRMVAMAALSLAAFALLGWLSTQPAFYLALGVRPNMVAPNDALALLLFMLVLPVGSFFFTPLGSWLSRRDEFEADAYACRQTSGADLAAALLKLHKDNAGTLTPDPVFARFYYSHPPTSERLAAIDVNPAAP